jgi:hypothetical protein
VPDWLETLDDDEREGWDEFVSHFRENVLHELDSSALVMSLVPKEFDVKFAVELGAAIMLDKPILAVVMPGAHVPEKLRRVVEMVVEVDIDTEEGRRTLATAIELLHRGDPEGS